MTTHGGKRPGVYETLAAMTPDDGRTFLFMGVIPERLDRCRIYDGAPPRGTTVDIQTQRGTVTADVYAADLIEVTHPNGEQDRACIEDGELVGAIDLSDVERAALLDAITEVL